MYGPRSSADLQLTYRSNPSGQRLTAELPKNDWSDRRGMVRPPVTTATRGGRIALSRNPGCALLESIYPRQAPSEAQVSSPSREIRFRRQLAQCQ